MMSWAVSAGSANWGEMLMERAEFLLHSALRSTARPLPFSCRSCPSESVPSVPGVVVAVRQRVPASLRSDRRRRDGPDAQLAGGGYTGQLRLCFLDARVLVAPDAVASAAHPGCLLLGAVAHACNRSASDACRSHHRGCFSRQCRVLWERRRCGNSTCGSAGSADCHCSGAGCWDDVACGCSVSRQRA